MNWITSFAVNGSPTCANFTNLTALLTVTTILGGILSWYWQSRYNKLRKGEI